MASQTLLSSFSAPKFATFNSLLGTPPLSLPTIVSCASPQLPTPCLKASSYGVGLAFYKSHFKCQADSGSSSATTDGVSDAAVGGKKEKILDAKTIKTMKEVEALGRFAVDEFNQQRKKENKSQIVFLRVVEADRDVSKYELRMEVEEGENKIKKIFKADVKPTQSKELTFADLME